MKFLEYDILGDMYMLLFCFIKLIMYLLLVFFDLELKNNEFDYCEFVLK